MSNSHSTSEQGTAGDASTVKKNLHRQHRVYRIAIFGDEQERTHVLTQIIAMPCVSVAISSWEGMDGKSTLPLRKSNSAKKATKTSKSVRLRTRKKTIN